MVDIVIADKTSESEVQASDIFALEPAVSEQILLPFLEGVDQGRTTINTHPETKGSVAKQSELDSKFTLLSDFVAGTPNTIFNFDLDQNIDYLRALDLSSLSDTALSSKALSSSRDFLKQIDQGEVLSQIYIPRDNFFIEISSKSEIIFGTAGEDTLIASPEGSRIFAGDGNDILRSGAGDDVLDGGDENDRVDYIDAASAVTIDLNIQGVAQDTLGSGNDTLINIERVTGSAFDDVLIGNADKNSLVGGDGNDTLIAGDGDDSLRGGAGDDILDGGDGIDLVLYSPATSAVTIDLNIQGVAQDTLGSGNDTLINIERVTGSTFDDILIGDGNDNRLVGLDGHDSLAGGDGDDLLRGDDGDDILYGGLGSDNLTGDAGLDRFVFEDLSAFDAVDDINDFNIVEGDIIDISDILTGYTQGVDDLSNFVRFVDSGANSSLEIDSDGIAGGVNFISVANILGGAGLDANTLEASGNLDTLV